MTDRPRYEKVISMKYILLFSLLVGAAAYADDIEVGTPKDCIDLGKSDDQGQDEDRLELQHKITDCLGPEDEEAKTEVVEKTRKVVSQ
jgi:hypothetical protein